MSFFSMASSEASINPLAIIMAGGVETCPVTNSNLSMNVNSETKPKKTNRGRIKIPIEKIMNKNRKHVTFSKRRKGLFKKATELCVLCDASVAIITFSEVGRVFTFGHPSTDAVIRRYLNGGDGEGATHLPIVASTSQLKQEYNGGGAIENPVMQWWDRPIEELGLHELEMYAEYLNQTLANLKRRITQLDYESQLDSKPLVKVDYSDHDYRLNQGGMLPATGNQMNYNEYDMMNGIGVVDPTINFVSPDFLSMATQYDQSNINSVVAMTNFNKLNRGYGEFGEF